MPDPVIAHEAVRWEVIGPVTIDAVVIVGPAVTIVVIIVVVIAVGVQWSCRRGTEPERNGEPKSVTEVAVMPVAVAPSVLSPPIPLRHQLYRGRGFYARAQAAA